MTRRSHVLLVAGLLCVTTLPALGAAVREDPAAATAGGLLLAMGAPGDDALAHAIGIAKAAGPGPAAAAQAPAHARPSEALLALAQRHGAVPTGEEVLRVLALDQADAPTRDALARLVDAFLAYDQAGAAGGDFAGVFPARDALLDAALVLRDALPAREASAAACAPIVVEPAFALDLVGCDATYIQDVAFLLDVGGDDAYHNNAGGTNGRQELAGRCGILVGDGFARPGALVDLGDGNDQYGDPAAPRGCGVNGGGYGSSGLLVDEGGDDAYVAGRDGTNGGAMFGVGLLLDAAGRDAYVAGDVGANGGSGYFGKGSLVDAGQGDDAYSAGEWGTNGGTFGTGLGILVDEGGTDAYRAGRWGTNGAGVPQSLGRVLVGEAASVGLLLDGGGNGDAYLDASPDCSGSGTDRTVVPKCVLGAQVDRA